MVSENLVCHAIIFTKFGNLQTHTAAFHAMLTPGANDRFLFIFKANSNEERIGRSVVP